jgi:hypothetical protein
VVTAGVVGQSVPAVTVVHVGVGRIAGAGRRAHLEAAGAQRTRDVVARCVQIGLVLEVEDLGEVAGW